MGCNKSTLKSEAKCSSLSLNILRQSPKIQDYPKGFLLHETIVKDNPRLCEKILLKDMVDINCPLEYFHRSGYSESRLSITDINATALHVACMYRRPSIIALLLKYGADPNLEDRAGRNSLYLTMIYWPRFQYFRDCSKLPKEERHYQDYLKQLHQKSESCLKEVCRYGANVNNFSDPYHQSALHIAARYNIHMAVPTLLEFGANIEANNRADGRTPLLVASSMGNNQLIKDLLEIGANIFAKDNKNMNILHLMCSSGSGLDLSVMVSLLNMKVNINEQNVHGDTPLHIAAAVGNEAIIQLLMSRGAKANILNTSKQSILYLYLNHVNCKSNKFIIQRILNETTQVRIYDSSGKLPLELQRSNRKELRDLLLQFSSQPSSLKHLCRCVIRETIGLKALTKHCLDNMLYPLSLKTYIYSNILYPLDYI